MARVTIEDALKKIPNQFDLINLAIERVRQLEDGALPLVEKKDPKETNIILALREIEAGEIDESIFDEQED